MRGKKAICFLLLQCLLFGSCIGFAQAAVQYPEKIRIGLYYADTAVSSFNVSAVNGFQAGSYQSGNFNVLYEEQGTNVLSVRKDSYYIKANGVFTEYNSLGPIGTTGDKIGPYHIRIGSNYSDRNAAFQQVQILKQIGISAYTAYADSWQVWTGFYTSQSDAQTDITNILIKKLGNGTYNVIAPSGLRLGIWASNGEMLFMFESATGIFQIHPKAENNPYALKINNSSYRGDLEVRRLMESDLTVINVLPIEQYLYGVVPSEMESNSPIEALKAQAVAARTYTYNNVGRFNKYFFDMDSTIKCQVYKGVSGESASGNMAVDETKEKKVTYNGSAARVFYFAASGGRTEDVKNVWGSEIPYLKSIDDKYETKNRAWEVSLTPAKIKETLAAIGYNIGDVTGMKVTKTAPDSGRVTELTIVGTQGKKIFTLESCRTIFSLSSQMYTISTDVAVNSLSILGKDSKSVLLPQGERKIITSEGLKILNVNNLNVLGALGLKLIKSGLTIGTPTIYKLSGKGWGHGIGMSQEGAKGMATAGFKYDQILTYYFVGTKVE